MSDFSIWHWLIICIFIVAPALLLTRISNRAGMSWLWFFVWLVPIVQWAGLWIFAFSRWPDVDRPGRARELDPR
ncbi:MAG: hypothetical protein KJ011_08675 [Burkholderiaceae bacterium]|nr:hypothetical protein [Burkholderiaceae bacterium]